jgi:hypothetical protein
MVAKVLGHPLHCSMPQASDLQYIIGVSHCTGTIAHRVIGGYSCYDNRPARASEELRILPRPT